MRSVIDFHLKGVDRSGRSVVILVLIAAVTAAACGGSGGMTAPSPPPSTSPPAPLPIPNDVSPTVRRLLEELPLYITNTLERQNAALPLNPQASAQIRSKITLLQTPTLFNEIVAGRLFLDASAQAAGGRTLPTAVVFPTEQMRAEAIDAQHVLGRGLPVLERFMQTPYPPDSVRVWYGFRVGSGGGFGLVDMEDRTTYGSRSPRLPYEAVVHHELAHTYIGNETLTQFLELYVYNVLQTGSTEPGVWPHTRDYVPMLESNRDIAAVLDVYRLIGHDAMSNAYRRVYPLRPVNRPLEPAVIQVFVDEAPDAVKAAVSQKLSLVTF